ncbi:hypothetical protein HPB50_001304 [Hyalomma asiaticum]|uniref:Uncharacterized protein n=1 Tax=Hyalomma asiaticum TaxID=266040 RepID=A0ACB7SDT6_HYAAI|nr:hypothetical protein HPB50_001304 [Hyalomma asiaticum]
MVSTQSETHLERSSSLAHLDTALAVAIFSKGFRQLEGHLSKCCSAVFRYVDVDDFVIFFQNDIHREDVDEMLTLFNQHGDGEEADGEAEHENAAEALATTEDEDASEKATAVPADDKHDLDRASGKGNEAVAEQLSRSKERPDPS